MNQAWTKEIERFEALYDHGLNECDFAGVFDAAFQRASHMRQSGSLLCHRKPYIQPKNHHDFSDEAK